MLSTSAAFIGGAGLATVLASTVKIASNFEQSMNILQAATHATTVEMAAASKAAQKLGADISLPATSAADAARAMTELAKGGLSVQQSIAAARGTLQLAAAAGTDVGTAAAITARQLNAFGLSGEEAVKVADVLANSANSATGEITDFAIAFQQSSSVAHQFGLSVEDTAAALTVMAKAGLIGSDAGTSLRVMLTRLVPQTAKAVAEMENLKVSFQDAQGNLTPFRDQIAQYQEALARLTPAERQLAVQVIFGTDAQRAANIIFNGGTKAFDKMRESVSKHGGAAQLAAARSKGFAGAVNALKSAIETTQISLGLLLLPTLTKYLHESAKWLGDTENQKRLQRDFKQAVELTGTAIGILANAVKIAKRVFDDLSDAVGGARNAMVLLVGAFTAFKYRNVVRGLVAIGTAAGESGAAGQVGLLQTRLGMLSRVVIPAIAIPVILELSAQSAGDPRINRKTGVEGAINRLPVVGTINKAFSEAAVKITDALGLTTKQTAAKVKASLSHLSIDPITGEVTTFVLGTAGKTVKETTVASKKANKIISDGIVGLATLSADRRNALALAAAARTATTADDLRLLVERRKILAVEIAKTQRALSGSTGKAAADLADTLQKLYDQDTAAMNQISSITGAAADKAKEAADKAKAEAEKRRQALIDLIGTLRHGAAQVGDLFKKYQAQVAAQIPKQISGTGRVSANSVIAAQFAALGLSPTGDEIAPSRKALRAQALRLGDAIKDTFLDTKKTTSVLEGVRKALAIGVGKLADTVSFKIKALLDDLSQQLGEHGKLPRAAARSSAKIAAELTRGLGLDAAGRKQLQQNILAANVSRGTGIIFGPNLGVGPRVSNQPRQDIHVHVGIDGREVAIATIPHINKVKRQSATQTSGRNAGDPNRFG
jgi:TP901 family phage tail tape measure protein